MSSIEIRCIKYDTTNEEEYKEKEKYHKDYTKEKKFDKSIELKIEASQWFMNTESFFNSVKESLIKYFDQIVKHEK